MQRSKSVSDILDLTDEERLQRAWKEKNGNERIPNKMNKMLVKAKKKWRSYEVEPGQLNLGQFNKMKEQHKVSRIMILHEIFYGSSVTDQRVIIGAKC